MPIVASNSYPGIGMMEMMTRTMIENENSSARTRTIGEEA